MEAGKSIYSNYVGKAYLHEFGGMTFIHELKGVVFVPAMDMQAFVDHVTMVGCYGRGAVVEDRLTDAEAFVARIADEVYKEASFLN